MKMQHVWSSSTTKTKCTSSPSTSCVVELMVLKLKTATNNLSLFLVHCFYCLLFFEGNKLSNIKTAWFITGLYTFLYLCFPVVCYTTLFTIAINAHTLHETFFAYPALLRDLSIILLFSSLFCWHSMDLDFICTFTFLVIIFTLSNNVMPNNWQHIHTMYCIS